MSEASQHVQDMVVKSAWDLQCAAAAYHEAEELLNAQRAHLNTAIGRFDRAKAVYEKARRDALRWYEYSITNRGGTL